MVGAPEGDRDATHHDLVAIVDRVEVKGLGHSAIFVVIDESEQLLGHRRWAIDGNMGASSLAVTKGMEGGDEVQTMVWMLMRQNDRIDQVVVDRKCQKRAGPGIAPDPGAFVFDQITGCGSTGSRVGS